MTSMSQRPCPAQPVLGDYLADVDYAQEAYMRAREHGVGPMTVMEHRQAVNRVIKELDDCWDMGGLA